MNILLKKCHKDIAFQNFYMVSSISQKQLNNAIKKFAKDLDKSKVIAFYDTSIFDTGKSGYIFTDTEVRYWEPMGGPRTLKYESICSVKLYGTNKSNDYKRELVFELKDGSQLIWWDYSLEKTPLYFFFTELIAFHMDNDELNMAFSKAVSGKCSKQVDEACSRILSEHSGTNTAVFYGKKSPAKIFLTQMLTNAINRQSVDKKCLCIAGKELVDSLFNTDKNEVGLYIEYLCNLDMLMICDIEELLNAKVAESVFRKVFLNMYQNNKRIVLIAENSPENLIKMSDDVQSRLLNGYIVEVI